MAIRSTERARELHASIQASLAEAGPAPILGPALHNREPLVSYGVPKSWWKTMSRCWGDDFAGLGYRDRVALARLLPRSHTQEQGHVAMAVLRAGVDQLRPDRFDDLDQLVDDFTSWSMTDDLATGKRGVMPAILARHPNETIALLERWSRSGNRWKRRSSVIVFTRRVAAEGRYTDVALRLCESLAHDEDDLVREGVGWALKDVARAGPSARRRVIALVKRMRREGVSSTVTLYAIRDLRGPERESVLRVKRDG